jgi:hypothetical protein
MGLKPLWLAIIGRLIVKFKRTDGGEWTGTMFSIDHGSDWGAGAPIRSITRQGAQVPFVVDATRSIRSTCGAS